LLEHALSYLIFETDYILHTHLKAIVLENHF